MSYDYDDRQVWVGDHPALLEPGAGYALCDRHADRVTPPVGWLLTDRRSSIRPLFLTRDVA
jgi:hypothetical protein